MNNVNQGITQETFTFINYCILGVIVGVIIWLYYIKREDESGLKSLPSIYTILGVFGTFLGISIGLSYFDSSPGEIENSVSFFTYWYANSFLFLCCWNGCCRGN
jgi:hypothetical protein